MNIAKKFYFTFGTDEQFPFQETYVIVYAYSKENAVHLYRAKYPDKVTGIVNCSEVYNEEEWEDVVRVSRKGAPADIIWPEPDTHVILKLRPFAVDICEIFEELLDKHNIRIPDEDREGASEEASVYGMTYHVMESDVVSVLERLMKSIPLTNNVSVDTDSF